MTDLRALLAPIKDRLEPALFHAPYRADGRKVIQANNHPSIRPYMLSDNSMPVIADFIANAPTDLSRLLAAIEAVESARQELFDMSNEKSLELLARAVYRDASRAIYTALAAALGSDTTNQETP